MNSFLSKFRSLVAFVLVGFDRLRLCGESRLLNHPRGVASYAFQRRVPRRDFPQHTKQLTDQLDHDTREQAEREGVPVKHVLDAGLEKDALALKMAAEHGITRGRIALLTAQENGMTYRPRKIGDDWGLRKEMVRCNHFYHYFLDDIFGLCYVRMQTYFPFTLRIGLNGRHWLARELTRRGVKFRQPDGAKRRVGRRIGVLVAPNLSLTVALYARLVRVVARFAALDPNHMKTIRIEGGPMIPFGLRASEGKENHLSLAKKPGRATEHDKDSDRAVVQTSLGE